MRENWQVIEEFPDYAVSDMGRVLNLHTELIKTPTQNQQGIPNVLLMAERKQFRRSVPVLVANAFIPREQPHFDTPIHVDGDRMNNFAENLLWRPRWFAVKYHKQFRPGYMPAIRKPIREVGTNRQFENSLDASVTYGILDTEIFLAVVNRTVVFPTNQYFEIIEA